jgi:hypothetical protein
MWTPLHGKALFERQPLVLRLARRSDLLPRVPGVLQLQPELPGRFKAPS